MSEQTDMLLISGSSAAWTDQANAPTRTAGSEGSRMMACRRAWTNSKPAPAPGELPLNSTIQLSKSRLAISSSDGRCDSEASLRRLWWSKSDVCARQLVTGMARRDLSTAVLFHTWKSPGFGAEPPVQSTPGAPPRLSGLKRGTPQCQPHSGSKLSRPASSFFVVCFFKALSRSILRTASPHNKRSHGFHLGQAVAGTADPDRVRHRELPNPHRSMHASSPGPLRQRRGHAN